MKSSGAYNELQEKYGSDYMKISSDRSLLPDYKWFFNMSSQCMLENFGHINSPKSLMKAEEKGCTM